MKATKLISNSLIVLLAAFMLSSIIFGKKHTPLSGNFTLSEWSEKCFSLPENSYAIQPSAVSSGSFYKELEKLTYNKKQELLDASKWTDYDENLPVSPIYFLFSENFQTVLPFVKPFIPFVRKLNLKPGAKVVFFGDLHGCVHSLLRSLNKLKKKGVLDNNFKLKDPNVHFMFLGDFVDRGIYGVEVLLTIMKLYNSNPNNVFFTRGNHEDGHLNKSYGFATELSYKFMNLPKDKRKRIYELYNLMPSAIYLGCNGNYVQCCHGGLEIGYNPKSLLASGCSFEAPPDLNRKDAIFSLSNELKREVRNVLFENDAHKEMSSFRPTGPVTVLGNNMLTLGFMWNDFIPNNPKEVFRYTPGRGWMYGKPLTLAVLESYSTQENKVLGVFRAHQHNGAMLNMLIASQGVVSLWNGIVYTFLSTPVSECYFPYDSFGILTISENYEGWTLEHLIEPVNA